MKLLQNPNVDRDQKIRNFLCRELEILFTLEEDDYLEERHETMYEQLKQIINSQGKVNRQVSRALTGTSQSSLHSPTPQVSAPGVSAPKPTIPHQPVTPELHSNNIISNPEKTHRKKHLEKGDGSHKINFIPSKPTVISNTKDSYFSISSIAFGKADWEKYFGDIGVEPPLPASIGEMLNEACSFWKGKKVKETHLLVLIPDKINRKPFTINCLKKLINKPKSGHSTKYECYNNYAKKAVGNKSYPSHWVLMTKGIIPGSKDKWYSECCEMVANHSKKTGLPYELPNLLEATVSILMHYVKTGERLYIDNQWTFTYSQDFNKNNVPLVVGGFAPSGLQLRISDIFGCGVAGCRKF